MNKLSFATKNDANLFLFGMSNLESHSGGFSPRGTYYLSNGEYSAPDFKPVRYKDGWGIKKVHYFYAGTCNMPVDGRCDLLDGELVLESVLG